MLKYEGGFKRKFIPLRSSYFISFISNSSDIIEGDKLLKDLKISTDNNYRFL